MSNKTIEFIRSKDFEFIKNIGQGGTGKTILIKDETIDEMFVCKKYSPIYEGDKPKYFKNFIDEIKILYTLNHRNVVRVFNYYLYHEQLTGYILMEYVNGFKIDEYLQKNPERLNDVFIQIIEGFCHLEQNKVLHRDIRPENILITESGVVKIIDFGFGKNFENQDNFEKSVSLNWRYPVPSEFKQLIYDIKTELYFIGKLFEEIIRDKNLVNFKFSPILKEMTIVDYSARPNSFFEVSRKLLANATSGLEFNEFDKFTYKNFADYLKKSVAKIEMSAEYISDIDTILMNLEKIAMNSMLEEHVQNLSAIPKCFIKGQFSYYKKNGCLVIYLEEFLKLMKSSTDDKKRILMNHIWQRLDTIERYEEDISDLPF